MSKALMCDNCARTIAEDDHDQRLFWMKVGIHDGYSEDACGAACARDLIDALEGQQRRYEGTHLHTFVMSDEESTECAECGGSMDAAWHELESVSA